MYETTQNYDIWPIGDVPLTERWTERTTFSLLETRAATSPERPALSFQLKSGPNDKAVTLTWKNLRDKVAQCSNLFRKLGIGEKDVIAYILPNSLETVIVNQAGSTAGIVNPINPLLSPDQIAGILNESGAKIVVTLAPFPKSDVAQVVAKALEQTPNVKHVLTVDLAHYLTPPLKWLIPVLRPKVKFPARMKVQDLSSAISSESTKLNFELSTEDRVAAYFHTGGTTGTPKLAQHTQTGMIYNGWLGGSLIIQQDDVLICPLPMFHVFAAYPILASCLFSGAHMVMVTPAGYRGDGVFDNFWKLIERWKVTLMITVPTAAAALMQRPINADVSTLKLAICGSAPLPRELFNRFETATGVKFLEGYGMTETTCLISCNPVEGNRKVGSVGLPLPYTDIKILDCAPDGSINSERAVGEIGEICVVNPGVSAGKTYTEVQKNDGLFAGGVHLRTGDLGYFDQDGYLWITGRAKDLIIRGGHNIDPADIENALLAHKSVSFVGAIGQPDAHAGEVPCAYVELNEGERVSIEELFEFANSHIGERAARPKCIEILKELPKTAVGKVFKPDLRKRAITRIYSEALDRASINVDIIDVVDDKRTGLTAILKSHDETITDSQVDGVLGQFMPRWRWTAD